VIYWDGDQLVVHDYATGRRISAAPTACAVLNFFDHWRSVEGLIDHLSDFTPFSVRKAVAALERQQLLIRKGRPANRTCAALEQWFLSFVHKGWPIRAGPGRRR
jgi:hypothetical protein